MSENSGEQAGQQDSSGGESKPPPNAVSPRPSANPEANGGGKETDGPKSASAAQKETLDAIKRGEGIALTIAGIVALCTIGQWVTACHNNVSSSIQTDKLIQAAQMSAHSADHNATSAFSFAQSADNINRGVADAVKKLDAQAKALDESRRASDRASNKALQATMKNFTQEQRPWVGVQDVQCVYCGIDERLRVAFRKDPNAPPRVEPISIQQLSAKLVNVGRTPAERVQVQFKVHAGEITVGKKCTALSSNASKCDEMLTAYDPTMVRDSKELIPPFFDIFQPPLQGVVMPDRSVPIPIATREFLIDLESSAANPKTTAVYVQGTVKYTDHSGEIYKTDFCFFAWPKSDSSFGFCKSLGSNSMH